MKDLIACCGLDCENCDARKATVNNDDALRKKTAKQWAEANDAPIKPEHINCMGCRTEGVKYLYCSDLCPVRKCVSEKGYDTCADCAEIDACEVVAQVFKNAPEARGNLRQNAWRQNCIRLWACLAYHGYQCCTSNRMVFAGA